MNGRYPAGSYPDDKIYNEKLFHFIQGNEGIMTDNGYGNYISTIVNTVHHEYKETHYVLRGRHEIVNGFLIAFVLRLS